MMMKFHSHMSRLKINWLIFFTKSVDAQRFIFLQDHVVVSRATLRFVTSTKA